MARKINLLVQWGADADPEISAYARREVPLIQDFGQNDLDRRVLVFIGSGAAFGRPLLAPPGVPPERVAVLRQRLRPHHEGPGVSGRSGEAEHGHQAARRRRAAEDRHRGRASPPEGLARAKELIGATR